MKKQKEPLENSLVSSLALELNYAQDGSLPSTVTVSPASQDGKPFLGHDGRAYLLDATKVAKATNATKLDVVGDCNHEATIPWSKPEAFAWLSNFRAENKAVVADINYTELGQEKLGKRLYRYISPAFVMSDDINVKRIHSIGFVNTPNFTMPAVNASQNHDGASHKKEGKMTEQELWDKLTTTQQQLVEANTAKVQAEGRLIALEAENKSLKEAGEKIRTEANAARLEGMLDQAIGEGKVAVSERDSLLKVNSAEVLAGILAARQAGQFQNNQNLGQSQVSGQAPGQMQTVQLNAEQQDAAKGLGLTEQEYHARYLAEGGAK